MKTSMQSKLDQLTTRLAELNDLLSREDVTSNLDQYRKLTREHAELGPVVEHYALWRQASNDAVTAQELLADAGMRDFAEEEIRTARERMEQLGAELQKMLLPKDLRFAERNRWQVEMMSASESDLGGYKEVIVRIAGEAAYSKLKFESGGHRVQRVPATETQGRIHTSACTVAVMPEADEIGEVEINPADLRIDTFRASGAGGQHINKTDSAVRVTHLPTGIVVECQDDRSQHKNKDRALKVLAARIKDKQYHEQHAKEAATRKSLIGSGDRSERIRTYNFPQGRLTDHRINLTLYRLESIMDGDLDELIAALVSEHQAELLASLGDAD
jgi:peptide chain release factor 1